MSKLCECGCGKEVTNEKNRFVHGHGARNLLSDLKRKQTCLKRYGVENPFSSNEIKVKIKQTQLEKYGVESSNQAEEIKEKKKQTYLKHYGVENPFSSGEIKEQIIENFKMLL